eukprot:XP_001696506.1 predicted protein [Chlamydomonas reinhardtii]
MCASTHCTIADPPYVCQSLISPAHTEAQASTSAPNSRACSSPAGPPKGQNPASTRRQWATRPLSQHGGKGISNRS